METSQKAAETLIILKYGSMDEAWMAWGDDMSRGKETVLPWERVVILNWINEAFDD